MALLTACPGLARVIGVPLLTEIGTARLAGICATTGVRITRSTSSWLSRSLDSARLSTTDRISAG